jgi:hypothetical protein
MTTKKDIEFNEQNFNNSLNITIVLCIIGLIVLVAVTIIYIFAPIFIGEYGDVNLFWFKLLTFRTITDDRISIIYRGVIIFPIFIAYFSFSISLIKAEENALSARFQTILVRINTNWDLLRDATNASRAAQASGDYRAYNYGAGDALEYFASLEGTRQRVKIQITHQMRNLYFKVALYS